MRASSLIFWRAIRYFLPLWLAVAGFISYRVLGFGHTTWVLFLAATALVFTWSVWGDWLNRKFEQPLIREEWREFAAMGLCDILFLRPFAVDQHWHQLRKVLGERVRAYNSQYASSKSVILLGRDDDGTIANLPIADEEWWTRFVKLADSASAIIILPLAPGAQSTSGILQEIGHVMAQHPDKAIFDMPSRAVWDRDLGSTPLAHQLEQLWAETKERFRKRSAAAWPSYAPAGCFWTLHGGYRGYEATTYTYSEGGAQEALFTVLDNQRVKRNGLMMKDDPQGFARLKLQREQRRRGIYSSDNLSF